jgi:hypothetical protein
MTREGILSFLSRTRRDIQETQERSSLESPSYRVSNLPGFGLSREKPNRQAFAVHFGRLEDRNAPTFSPFLLETPRWGISPEGNIRSCVTPKERLDVEELISNMFYVYNYISSFMFPFHQRSSGDQRFAV